MSGDGYLVIYFREPGQPCMEHHGAIRPHAYHEAFAARLFGELNRLSSHGGAWSVTWKGLITLQQDNGELWFGWPTIWVASWFDADGDLQFEVGNDEHFNKVMNENIETWIDQCEHAYQQWVSHLIDVGVRADQTIQHARGQRSIDPDDQPDL
jgi:hypothetical protein